MIDRESFCGRAAPGLAVGLVVGAVVTVAAFVVGGATGDVAGTLFGGVAATSYYALRYGDPSESERFVPARTVVQVLLWLLLARAFVGQGSLETYVVELLALGSAVLAIVLSVLVEATDPESDPSP